MIPANRPILLSTLGLLSFVCLLSAAQGQIPALDDLAGDWKNREDLEQFPSIYNFNGQMLVNKDTASISWLASPPFSQGFHSGALKFNGKVIVAQKFRWYPYQAERSGAADGLAIKTTNRMVFDERGVLWRITLSNDRATALNGTLSVDLIGVISKLTAPGSWDWAYFQPGPGGPKFRHFETEAIRAAVDETPSRRPANGGDYRATVAASKMALVVDDTKTDARTVFAFTRKPDTLDSDGHQGVAAWQIRLAPGETRLIDFVMAFGQGDQVSSDASRWAHQFESVFADAKTRWEQRFAQAFTPRNGYFGGHLPTLETDDPALRRNYYMGVLTILLMLRDQLPHGSRVFVAGGPRYGASVQFIWDTGLMDTLFALLEPQAMRVYVAKTLQWDLDHCLAFDYYGNRAFGYRYVANYPMLFRIATTYLKITGDRAFLDEKVGSMTVLEQLDRLALHYQKYLMSDGKLADFGGDPNHFLECVPTYIHATAGFNAAYVAMLRDMAELHDSLGHRDLAANRLAAAAKLVQAIPQLYVPGKGFWQSRYPDGRQFDMRHCLDFQFVAQSIPQDLSPAVRKEMRDFVVGELLMKDWMRAQSLQDPAAAKSERPDHGPMGAFPSWPPETADGLCYLGYWKDAIDFYRRCEAVTHEGAFSQGHGFYGPKKRDFDAPVRIANAGTNCREALGGGDFAGVMIRTFFGFSPSLNGKGLLRAPDQPRGFSGKLRHLRSGTDLVTITSGPRGLTMEKE